MDILFWLWIIYFIGSFIFSSAIGRKAKIEKVNKEFQKFNDEIKTIDPKMLKKKDNSQRSAVVQQNNQRAQALRNKHSHQSSSASLKDTALDTLKQTLTKVREINDLSDDHEFKYSLSSMEYLTSSDITDPFDQLGDSGEYFDESSEHFEEQLHELDDWYSDSSLEDASWMEIDAPDILVEEKQSSGDRKNHIYAATIKNAMKDKDALRKYMVFNEVISKPKSLRR